MDADQNARNRVVVEEGDFTDHPLVAERDVRFTDQPHVVLPSGRPMPALGLGTWQLEGEALGNVVDAALELGFRHIDTAQMYGNESEIGAALEAASIPRDEIFLTTKVDNDHHEPAALVASVEASLERLQTDHVDLLLIHWPVEFERVGATLSALAQVQAGGLAHHIGVSNFTVEQLDQVADLAPLEVLQCECHPYFQQTQLRSWCAERGWAFTAYSPLGRGDVTTDDVLDDIAAAHDVSPASVALAWLIAQDQVTTIPKTSDVEHLQDNWSALSLELDPLELDRISALDEGRRLVDPDVAPW